MRAPPPIPDALLDDGLGVVGHEGEGGRGSVKRGLWARMSKGECPVSAKGSPS